MSTTTTVHHAEPQFAFVLEAGLGKPKATDRRLIRSRCMQGKNKREGSRRSKQQEKKVGKAATTSQSPPTFVQAIHGQELTLRAPPSGFALVQLPGELGENSDEVLYKYLTFDAMRTHVTPIETCVNVDPLKPKYMAWPFYDTTFFHAAMLTTSATNDYILKRSMTKPTYFHLRRTLHFLNQKLAEKDAHLVDSTVYVVIMLTLMAATFGDFTAAAAHMNGLKRIMDLRGGAAYLKSNINLNYKLDRLDLSWCLGFGGAPRFADTSISWDPMFPIPISIPGLSPCQKWAMASTIIEPRLFAVLNDVRHLVGGINSHVTENTRFHGGTFQVHITSIQSRLLLLKDMLSSGTVDECLCLALLAFMTTTFQIPGKKVPYRDLRRRLREANQSTLWGGSEVLRNLGCWVLMVCAISVLDDDEEWLVVRWEDLVDRDTEWVNLRRTLRGVMWIDSIHDWLGKAAFQALTSASLRRKPRDAISAHWQVDRGNFAKYHCPPGGTSLAGS